MAAFLEASALATRGAQVNSSTRALASSRGLPRQDKCLPHSPPQVAVFRLAIQFPAAKCRAGIRLARSVLGSHETLLATASRSSSRASAPVAASRRGPSGPEGSGASSSEAEALDELCPSLDSDVWGLLLEKPSVPSPLQGEPGSDDLQTQELERRSRPDTDEEEWRWGMRTEVEPRASQGRSQWPAQSRESVPEHWQTGARRGNPYGRGVQGASTGRSDSPSFSQLKEEHWRVRQTVYEFLHTKYEAGEELIPEDVEFVVENVLRFHPKAAEKMGGGVTGIKADVHPDYGDTKCFFVYTEGAREWVDFSYLKCLDQRWQAKMGKPKGREIRRSSSYQPSQRVNTRTQRHGRGESSLWRESEGSGSYY